MQHVILLAEVGTRSIERQSATYSEVYSYLSKQVRDTGILFCTTEFTRLYNREYKLAID